MHALPPSFVSFKSSLLAGSDLFDTVHIQCDGHNVTEEVRMKHETKLHNHIQLWSSNPDAHFAEAVCIKIKCDMIGCGGIRPCPLKRRRPPSSTACVSRILGAPSLPPSRIDMGGQHGHGDMLSKRPANVLVIAIRSMSRAQMERMMPRTMELLRQSAFADFGRHIASGDHHKSAYSSLFLRSYPESKDGEAHHKWLWDHLSEMGYATLAAEDQCVGADQTLMQGSNRNRTHGASLEQMLCWDFDFPNCLGIKQKAQHLIDYTKSFIRQYDGVVGDDVINTEHQPWAAFLGFADADEDTMTLAGVLDNVLAAFLHWLHKFGSAWSDTIVLITSNHGLDRGSYVQSYPQEFYLSPLLLKLPDWMPSQETEQMLSNSKMMWTSPFDIYNTIFHAATGQVSMSKNRPVGTSLLVAAPTERLTCQGTMEIPDEYCELANQSKKVNYWLSRESSESSSWMSINPPSVLSFYADIPREDRPKWPECQHSAVLTEDKSLLRSLRNHQCNCSTSHKSWYSCNKKPILGGKSKINHFAYFSMIDCKNKTLHLDTNFPRLQELVDRSAEKRATLRHTQLFEERSNLSPPSILFIEVDSVSVAYADRHFPKTRELLKRHRPKKIGDKYTCQNDLCAASFSNFGMFLPVRWIPLQTILKNLGNVHYFHLSFSVK